MNSRIPSCCPCCNSRNGYYCRSNCCVDCGTPWRVHFGVDPVSAAPQSAWDLPALSLDPLCADAADVAIGEFLLAGTIGTGAGAALLWWAGGKWLLVLSPLVGAVLAVPIIALANATAHALAGKPPVLALKP